MIFVWAGLMHPLAWVLCWLWLGMQFKPANVDTLPDLSRVYRPLLLAGASIALAGLAGVGLILLKWSVCVAAVKVPGAAQAATAAAGVVLIGLALFYAGLSRGSVRSHSVNG